MGDASCLGPLAGLEKQRTRYRTAVDSLADGRSRGSSSWRGRGFGARRGGAHRRRARRDRDRESASGDQWRHAGRHPGRRAASALAARDACGDLRHGRALAKLPRFVSFGPRTSWAGGAAPLCAQRESERRYTSVRRLPDLPPLGGLVDEIARPGRGLIMTMGKGGVGKTTIAAAVAVELAARGHDVLLTTTDPAAHLCETLAADVPNLTVGRIDPAVETARYRDHVLATKGCDLDAGRAMLEEDLRSPCTEEIAVFQAFSKVIRESSRHFVVMDTAPTGHTLLLLDATGSYHRDIVRHAPARASHRHADDAAAGSRPDQDPDRDAARDHAGARGRAPAGGSAPGRDRALGLGGQRQPRGDRHPPSIATA